MIEESTSFQSQKTNSTTESTEKEATEYVEKIMQKINFREEELEMVEEIKSSAEQSPFKQNIV